MLRTPLRCVLGLAMTLIFGTGVCTGAPSPLDGRWSVVVFALAGSCDGAYRFPLRIVNGAILYDLTEGSGVVDISGKVEAGGRIEVTVQHGNQQAVAAGRLTPTGGTGTWVGAEGNEKCSGRWEAKRD